jgi:ABC-type nitrate/sulfonate/bicarbonate transport system permease component
MASGKLNRTLNFVLRKGKGIVVTTQPDVLRFEELTSAARRSVYWSYSWRSLVIALIGLVGGAILGGIIGFVIGFAATATGGHVNKVISTIRVVSMLVGSCWALFLIPYFVRWIFRIRSGAYVIRFVRSLDVPVA